MKRANFSICIPLLFVTMLVFLAGSTSSADDKIGPYKKIATIPSQGDSPVSTLVGSILRAGPTTLRIVPQEALTSSMPSRTTTSFQFPDLSDLLDEAYRVQTELWPSLNATRFGRVMVTAR
jgi:hypothetical protein